MRKGVATLYGRPISDKWRVCFTPTIYAASLPRKTDRLTEFLDRREGIPLTRLMQRYIRAASYAGTRKTTGIAVDSPSHLFLAGREYDTGLVNWTAVHLRAGFGTLLRDDRP